MADESANKPSAAPTEYLVLARLKGDTPLYTQIGRYLGSSGRALKHFSQEFDSNDDVLGLVAVPVRSWTEVELSVVTPPPRTTLKRVKLPSSVPPGPAPSQPDPPKED